MGDVNYDDRFDGTDYSAVYYRHQYVIELITFGEDLEVLAEIAGASSFS